VTEESKKRFQFRLSTLLIVVSGFCLLLKQTDAFGLDIVIAALFGGAVGVVVGWRSRAWLAVIGGAIAFWIPHWRFLIPGCPNARLGEPDEYFVAVAAGSLLALAVNLSRPQICEGESPSTAPVKKKICPDRWGLRLWLLALVGCYACALLTNLDFPADRFGWGDKLSRWEHKLLFCLSALVYVPCLLRGAMVYRRIVSVPRRFPSATLLLAATLGVSYIVTLLAVVASLSLQLTSAGFQNQWPAICQVVGLTLLLEVTWMVMRTVERRTIS